MKETLIIAPVVEVKKIPSFAEFIEMRTRQLLKELDEHSKNLEKETNKLVDIISNS
jgi:hypothetical protein